jgi:hypothetical protein
LDPPVATTELRVIPITTSSTSRLGIFCSLVENAVITITLLPNLDARKFVAICPAHGLALLNSDFIGTAFSINAIERLDIWANFTLV